MQKALFITGFDTPANFDWSIASNPAGGSTGEFVNIIRSAATKRTGSHSFYDGRRRWVAIDTIPAKTASNPNSITVSFYYFLDTWTDLWGDNRDKLEIVGMKAFYKDGSFHKQNGATLVFPRGGVPQLWRASYPSEHNPGFNPNNPITPTSGSFVPPSGGWHKIDFWVNFDTSTNTQAWSLRVTDPGGANSEMGWNVDNEKDGSGNFKTYSLNQKHVIWLGNKEGRGLAGTVGNEDYTPFFLDDLVAGESYHSTPPATTAVWPSHQIEMATLSGGSLGGSDVISGGGSFPAVWSDLNENTWVNVAATLRANTTWPRRPFTIRALAISGQDLVEGSKKVSNVTWSGTGSRSVAPMTTGTIAGGHRGFYGLFPLSFDGFGNQDLGQSDAPFHPKDVDGNPGVGVSLTGGDVNHKVEEVVAIWEATDEYGAFPSETAAGADSLSINATVPVSEARSGSDSLTVGNILTATDSGVGSEIVLASIGAILADTGSGSESPTITATVPPTDTGSGATTLSITSFFSIAENPVGTDAVTAGIGISLTESPTGSDTPNVTANLLLQDFADGVDSVTFTTKDIWVNDTTAGVDSLAIDATIPPTDSGTGSDVVSSGTSVSVSDTGALSVETITVDIQNRLSDSGLGVTTLDITVKVMLVASGPPVSGSEGPRSPGTVVSDASFGDSAWSHPGNATASDDSRATASVGPAQPDTEYLKATNFGFSIPGDATISGIVAEFERHTATASDIVDSRVRIVKGGTVGSTDRSSGAGWPNTDTYASFGSSSDLWGTTWTPSDINASGFGVVLAARHNAGSSPEARVDHVRITVHYTTPGVDGVGGDSGTGAESVAVTFSHTQTDSGSGSDTAAATVSISTTDSGSGSDTPSISQVTIPIIDWQGRGTESLNISVSFTTTDAGSGAESPIITATVPVTDTTSGSDTPLVTAQFTLAETGSGADVVIRDLHVSLADTSSGSDTPSVTATISPGESGLGVDVVSIPSLSFTVADVGSGVDVVSLSVTVTPGDSGSGAEVVSVSPSVPVADSGSGSDTPTVTATVPPADSGTAVETLTINVSLTVTDARTGSDTVAITATISPGESGTGAETITVSPTVTVSDSGPGTDVVTVSPQSTVSDVGSVAEVVTISVTSTVTDDRSGSDTIAVTVTVPPTDSGSGSDVVSLTQTISVVDSGTGADTPSPAITAALADLAVAVESLLLSVTAPVTETATGIDPVSINVNFTLADVVGGDDVIGQIDRIIAIAESGAGNDAMARWRDLIQRCGVTTRRRTSVAADRCGEIQKLDRRKLEMMAGELTNVTVTDSGVGVDAIEITRTVSITDVGVGVDAVAVDVSFTLAESGSGADTPSVTAHLPTIDDSGSGSDTATGAISASVTDSGTGSDAVLSPEVTVPVSESGTGSDTTSIDASMSLTDSGSGVDSPAITANVSATDTGSGTDGTPEITATVSPTDSGSGSDAVAEIRVTVPVTETGTGVEVVSVDTGAKRDVIGAFAIGELAIGA